MACCPCMARAPRRPRPWLALSPAPATHTPRPPAPPQAAGRRLQRPVVCLMTRPSVSVAPDPSVDWPPGGSLVIPSDSYLIIHGQHGAPVFNTFAQPGPGVRARRRLRQSRALPSAAPAAARRRHRGGERRRLVELPEAASAAAAAHSHNETGHVSKHAGRLPIVSLAMGYVPSVFTVAHSVNKDGGMVELQAVRLTQLAQGAGAGGAASLEDPAVWTLMLWGIQRWGGLGGEGCWGRIA
jgi:hypothetical protein